MEIISARSQTTICFIHCHSKGSAALTFYSLHPHILGQYIFTSDFLSVEIEGKERMAFDK